MPNEIKIGGSTFTVSPLPAMTAFELQPEIAPLVGELLAGLGDILKRLGPAVAGLLGKKEEEGSASVTSGELLNRLLDSDVSNMLGPLLTRAAAALPRARLRELTRELLATATIDNQLLFNHDGQGDKFQVVMRGRTLDTWRLLVHAVQVNYPDFFGARGANGSAATEPAPSAK